MRRLLLVSTALMLSNYPAFQCQLYIFASQLNIMYVVSFKPFYERQTNFTEIFNEGCVLIVGYLLFIFTDFVDSLDCKKYAGYAIISIIAVNFGGNIVLQVVQMCQNIPKVFNRVRNSQFCRRYFKKGIQKAQVSAVTTFTSQKVGKYVLSDDDNNHQPWHLDDDAVKPVARNDIPDDIFIDS